MKLYFPYKTIKYISQYYSENLNDYYKNNGLAGHGALDIVGNHRENIYASCDGFVYSIINKDNSDLSKYRAVYQLIEEDGIAYELSYGHLMDIYVQPNTFVKRGTLIGTQGNTGNVFVGGKEVTTEMKKNNSSAGSHLHFQLRLLKPVNYFDQSKAHLYNQSGLFKKDGNFYQIPEFDNGYNGCIDPKPFLIMESAVGVIQIIYDFLFPTITQTLRYGSRGEQVKILQKKLGIKSDGIFGIQTLTKVKEFQKSNDLVADGIVGTLTRQKLNSVEK